MGCMIYGQGRGGGGEPPSARVQLAGQTLGHIFSVAPPSTSMDPSPISARPQVAAQKWCDSFFFVSLFRATLVAYGIS